jgi:hypothetical protein
VLAVLGPAPRVSPIAPPAVPRVLRGARNHAKAPMDTGSFDYEREGGTVTTAGEKAEGAVAAAADVTLVDATCAAKTISHT